MIYGNCQHIWKYKGLLQRLDLVIDYVRSHDLESMEPGYYPIQENDVWLRISDNQTKPECDAVYEAHDQFLDVHMVVKGQEVILCAFRGSMDGVAEVFPERDLILFQGKGQPIILSDWEYLILFPDDVHAPSICVSTPGPVRKALFKVRV